MTNLTPSDSAETTVRCRRGGLEQPSTNTCSDCGSFLPGNTKALVHGGRRFMEGSGTALDEARRTQIEANVLEDLGGVDKVSEVQRRLVADFAGAVVLRELVFAHLQATGPLTKAGRRRACTTLYFDASARVERLAKLIGTQRRAGRIPTLDEVLHQQQEGKA